MKHIELSKYLGAVEKHINDYDKYVKAVFMGDSYQVPKIQREFGIYDNWTMYMEGDYEKFLEYLNSSGRYKFNESGFDDLLRQKFDEFYSLSGSVSLVASEVGNELYVPSEEDITDLKETGRYYNIRIMLHPFFKEVKQNSNQIKKIALVTLDIGKYSIENNLEFRIGGGAKFYRREVIIVNHKKS